MIVGATPSLRRIAFEVRGPLAALAAWNVLATAAHYALELREPPLPVALIGAALSLVLGFRTNAAYARWWEARTLWGSLVNASRSLARMTATLDRGADERTREVRDRVVMHQITYAHVLRHQLRGSNPSDDVERLVGIDEVAHVLARRNRPNALLEDVSRLYGEQLDEGRIDTVQQRMLEATLSDVANAQGGMERIKGTPLPSGFRAFPDVATKLFCAVLPFELLTSLGLFAPVVSIAVSAVFLGALRIGDDLTDPFAGDVHDVPMTAMCRTIEIDLLQTIGRPAPNPLPARSGVLW